MTVDGAVEIIRYAFWTALVTGAPILLIGFLGGVVVSIVQVLTSMQDPAFNTVPRLLLFLASAVFLLPWMADRMLQYTREILGGLEKFAV